MSNATPDTRGTGGDRTGGDRRRRRSRGGKGRNRQRHDSNGESRDRREPRQQSSHRSGQGNRQERGPRPPRRETAPVKLTWWQKLLSLFGLYKPKEIVRISSRPEREERKPRLNIDSTPRPGIGDQPAREPREPREPRGRDRDRDRDRESRRNQERPEVASTRIYLGNLSYDTSEEDLKDLFKGVGSVRRVEIIYNRRTHKSKGYGFVDMLNLDDAKRAVEVLHDQFFMGRRIVVSGAKSKEYEEASAEERAERESPVSVRLAPLPAAAVTETAEEAAADAAAELSAEAVEVTYSFENPEPVRSAEAVAAPELEAIVETVAEAAPEPEAIPSSEAPVAEEAPENRTQEPS